MKSKEQNKLVLTVSQQVKFFFVSIRFLTIIPCGRIEPKETEHFSGALFYFTLTGSLIGSLALILTTICMLLFSPTVTAAIVVIFLSSISGFIHMDGLADTSDGFLSNTPKEKCLEIMRDSRIGVMGAVAIISVFFLKFSAISSINPEELPLAIFLVPIAGRTAIIMMMTVLPYAREGVGLGKLFYSTGSRKAALFSCLFIAIVTLIVDSSYLLPIFLSLFFVIGVFSMICKKKIGGATGDTLGAVCELTESIVLLALTITF